MIFFTLNDLKICTVICIYHICNIWRCNKLKIIPISQNSIRKTSKSPTCVFTSEFSDPTRHRNGRYLVFPAHKTGYIHTSSSQYIRPNVHVHIYGDRKSQWKFFRTRVSDTPNRIYIQMSREGRKSALFSRAFPPRHTIFLFFSVFPFSLFFRAGSSFSALRNNTPTRAKYGSRGRLMGYFGQVFPTDGGGNLLFVFGIFFYFEKRRFRL